MVDDAHASVQGVYTSGVGIAIDPETLLIVNQPEDQTCILLDNVMFECVAESPSQLLYQWYMNDKVIVGKNLVRIKSFRIEKMYRLTFK